ncbi:MAG TPA: Crp/Fnr family transcriptional regulator [Candidatus Mediterraneibacter cottocaccae]|nr:Crp/Fnr family transcriptional regulator [Candidatus Mediterraneibacter cottocaccae]
MVQLRDCFPFWEALTEEQRGTLEKNAVKRRFEKGRLLHAGQEDCVGLIAVAEGLLRVFTVSEEGKELTLYRLLERDVCLFSASCIFQDIRFDVMVSAAEETEVYHIPAEIYRQLMETSLPVMEYTSRLMASRFSDVMWLMDQVMNKKLDSRLAAFLLEEADRAGQDRLELTHEEIGGHLGSAREVVSRMLKHFQKEGLVGLGRGSITLDDREGLARLAENSLM